MAFETDDQGRKRPTSDPPASLGDLAAGLDDIPGRRAELPAGGSSAGEDAADEAIDSAALAALSQAQSGRKPGVDEAGGSSVRLADVPAELARARPSVPSVAPAPPPRPRVALVPVLAALAVGFGLGLPAGGYLFGGRSDSELSAARQPREPAPQPSAAKRAEDVAAAARFPLPGPNARVAPALPPSDDTPPPAAADEPRPSVEQAASPPPAALAVMSDAQKLRAPARAATKAPAAASGNPTQPEPTPPPPAASPAAPKPAVPARADNGSVDSLIDRALAETGTPSLTLGRAPSAAPAPAGVPLAPSRDDVTRAMTVLLPAIRGCAGGESGLATLGIVVRNDGHVENVTVSGAPFEGARSGRCMEGVVRKAKFPRFQQSSFRVQFPFQIQ